MPTKLLAVIITPWFKNDYSPCTHLYLRPATGLSVATKTMLEFIKNNKFIYTWKQKCWKCHQSAHNLIQELYNAIHGSNA